MTPADRLPVADRRTVLRSLAAALPGQRLRLLLVVLLLIGGSSSALATPWLLGRIVDLVSGAAGGTTQLLAIAGLLLGTGALSAGLGYLGGLLLVGIIQRLLAALREDAMDAVLRADLEQVEAGGSSDVVSRITRDVESITEAASGVLPAVLGAGFTIALSFSGILLLDPRLALAALVAVPVQVLTTRRFVRASHRVYGEVRAAEADRGQSILESVSGARTVRAHVLHHRRLAEADRRSRAAISLQHEAARLRTRFWGGINTAELVGLLALLGAGYLLVGRGAVTVGAATAAVLYFHRLFGPIGALLSSVDDLQLAAVGLARIVGAAGVRPRPPATRDMSVPLPDAAATGHPHAPELRAEGVSFRYRSSGAASLRDIDLRVPAGATVALVGASGSGKSTLARLLAGSLEPSRGVVAAVGPQGRAAPQPPEVLLLTQEVHLFAGTVAENLLLARPDASPEQLESALEEVGAEWALRLPEGLATRIGPGEPPLGLARAQHLALARVVLADPPAVVLDEPTAECGRDPLLDDALERSMRGRTAIVVAHRLAHAQRADAVVVLEHGRIIEQGPHEDLRAAGGAYARLWQAWSVGTPARA